MAPSATQLFGKFRINTSWHTGRVLECSMFNRSIAQLNAFAPGAACGGYHDMAKRKMWKAKLDALEVVSTSPECLRLEKANY